ncbi:MAG: glycosyltransferase family 2 protein [Salibacteraceae bacterium]
MPDNPLISILMTVKDEAPFLHQCLDSIRDQTERHWELIMMDDISSDGSEKIMAEYAAADPRMKLFPGKGLGVIPGVREAYRHSSGQLITRIDGDDYMSLQKLERLKAIALEHGPGTLATGLTRCFADDGLGEGWNRYELWLNDLNRREANWTGIYKECVVASSCWMVYRQDLDGCESFVDERYPEDYDLAFRFYRYGLKVKTCPEYLHHWRDHPVRISRTLDHYADQRYYALKMRYFFEIDRREASPLVVWGAGRNGKDLALLLQKMGKSFTWTCDNPRKWGHTIYGQKIVDPAFLESEKDPQILVAVSGREIVGTLKTRLEAMGFQANQQFFLLF